MNQAKLSSRQFVIMGIMIAVAVIYVCRLFYIQVIVDKYKIEARKNAFHYLVDYPPRGDIFDRNNKKLVVNEVAYDLFVVPKEVKGTDTMTLCNILGITKAGFLTRIKKASQHPNSPRKASVFEKALSRETQLQVSEIMKYKLSGFYFVQRPLRNYPMPIAAHLLGYIGEASEEKVSKDAYYKSGDYIGISGIEKSYERYLRGVKGTRIVLKDVNNREHGSYMNGMYDTIGVAGKALYCTIDADLQLYGEQLMKGKRGSIVAIDPETGEILCMVSSPNYDPNLTVGRARGKNFGKLQLDTVNLPLFNRALNASYPPGSTFKLMDALIGQQEGVLSPSTIYPCNSGYPPMNGKPKCHPHAATDLYGSIAQSCNSYYSYVFRSIVDKNSFKSFEAGYENWRNHILSFGVGRHLNTDLPYELIGNVPSIKYYDKVFGKDHWRSNTVVSLGIGQAELGILPVQMANVICVIANRGFYHIPHIIKSIQNDTIPQSKWKEKHYCTVEEKYFIPVIEGMARVVESGTARASKIPDIVICGKTGTAQNPHGRNHAVFVAFAPRDTPKIAIACVVENCGYGGTWAAPIVSLMIEKYMHRTIKRKEMEKRMIDADLINNKNIIPESD